MPGKGAVRAGALLLWLVACSKPAEVRAAGGGNSTPPPKERTTAPAAPPAPAAPAPQAAGKEMAAPAPAATVEAVEAQVLIWGGGRTPEEGRKALERFEAERGGLEALLSLGEGYPRVIASDTLPGLKPGFHVVVLGACKPEEAKEPLSTLQAFKPGVYARPVKLALGAGSCPKPENGLGWAQTERVGGKPLELTAVYFMASDASASRVPWLVRLYLRDAAGDLVDQDAVDPRAGIWEGTDRNSCFAQLSAESPALRVTMDCENLAGGPGPQKRHEEYVYKIQEGKIAMAAKPR